MAASTTSERREDTGIFAVTRLRSTLGDDIWQEDQISRESGKVVVREIVWSVREARE